MYVKDQINKYLKIKPKGYIRKIQSLKESYGDPEVEDKINRKFNDNKNYQNVNNKFNLEILIMERKLLSIFNKKYPNVQESTVRGKVDIKSLIISEIKAKIEPFPDKKKAVLDFCSSRVMQEMLFEELFDKMLKLLK